MRPRFDSNVLVRASRLVVLLVALDFVWIILAIVLRLSGPSPGPPEWIGDPNAIIIAVAEHAFTGFLVGAATLSMERALVGAAFGPLIDADHISPFLNLPADPRIGHSLVLAVILVMLAWQVRLWPWRPMDLGLFAFGQYLIHFGIAPPGFPLLAPFTDATFYFPGIYAAVPGIVLAPASYALGRIHGNRSGSDPPS